MREPGGKPDNMPQADQSGVAWLRENEEAVVKGSEEGDDSTQAVIREEEKGIGGRAGQYATGWSPIAHLC